MPSVDIIVPCYNYAHYLESCVTSILSQRDVDVRVLIINDCSPDHTDKIGSELAASDPRVEYLKNEQNLGLIGTANRGLLDWACADYALLLSADDLLTPGSLARACAVMDHHRDVHLVYGRAVLIGDEFGAAEMPADEGDAEYQLIDGRDFIQRNFTHFNPVPSPTAVVRTHVQKELGGYLPQFPHTSDMEMWMRFAAGGPIGVIKNVQACYRIHASSMSAEKLMRAISDREECLETCAFVVENFCDAIPDAQTWLVNLKRKMATDAYWLANHPRYTADERRTCAEFAIRTDPSRLVSLPRLKFEMKKLWRAFQSSTPEPRSFNRLDMASELYGWWPEAKDS